MPRRYRVQIPVASTELATPQFSKSYALTNGLELPGILQVRTTDETTLIELEISADNYDAAVAGALSISRKCVQLIALLHEMGFELSLSGIIVETLESPDQPAEVWSDGNGLHVVLRDSFEMHDRVSIRAALATFEPLAAAWDLVPLSGDHDDAVTLALEWVYLGTLARDERNAYLAYWVALELLMTSAGATEAQSQEDKPTKIAHTVIERAIPLKADRVRLRAAMDALLTEYVTDTAMRNRVMEQVSNTKAESDIDRWLILMQAAGIKVTSDDIRQLRHARGSLVHSGTGELPVARLREIVTAYLKVRVGLEAES